MSSVRYISSARVVFNDSMGPATIEISDGKITAVGPEVQVSSGDSVTDFGNLVISPGLVDIHVHINEPGRTDWEGFETATRAAAAGGVTTLVDMPLNSSPVTTSAAALQQKLDSARGKLAVDCAFHGGVVRGNAAQIPGMLQAGVAGLKAFLVHSGIDEFPETGETDLRQAMTLLSKTSVPLLAHAELEVARALPPAGSRRYTDWVNSRPPEMETTAIELLGRLAHETSARIHIVHVASKEAVESVRRLKQQGIAVTAETCPHYLTFASENIPDGATEYKCAPPIRSAEHRDALWRALEEGVLDLIASDHSPSPPELKCLDTGDFGAAWGGIASLQFLLPAVWTEANRRGHSLQQLASWLSEQPARLVGLGDRKGRIATGWDADLVVWDPDATFEVTRDIIHHRHKLTPYLERRLRGRIAATFLRGELIAQDGIPSQSPTGTILLRKS